MIMELFHPHDVCPYGPGPWHACDEGDNEFVGCGSTPMDAVTRLVQEMEPYAVAAKRAERINEAWQETP